MQRRSAREGEQEGSFAAPWLSVVMPVHDAARWLDATLESAASEDCTGIEFLVRDSSGDEACCDIVRTYVGRLRIDYRRCPEDLSWPSKTNLAVADAQAAYVTMLHADDIWLPGRVAAIRASIRAHPGAVLHLNPSQIIDENGRELGTWRCPFSPGVIQGSEAIEHLLVQNFIAIPAPVIRRSVWLKVGGMDESLWYTGDWDLYLKLLRFGPAVYAAAITTAYRIHRNSLTTTGSRNGASFREQLEIVLARHCAEAQPSTIKVARASIAMNSALAGAASGQRGAVWAALRALLSLSPRQIGRYFSLSRIAERAMPRLRMRLAGRM
jgi:glycosyltransferase involved in cell wall biosynthesis